MGYASLTHPTACCDSARPQAKRIVEVSEWKKTSIRGDARAVEFELQAAVKSDGKITKIRFTHRQCHQISRKPPLSI
jgi:hypothetical protein